MPLLILGIRASRSRFRVSERHLFLHSVKKSDARRRFTPSVKTEICQKIIRDIKMLTRFGSEGSLGISLAFMHVKVGLKNNVI